MKVALDIAGTRGGHAVRGIGFYTNDFIKSLERLSEVKSNDFRLFPVDTRKVDIGKYDLVHHTCFHPYFINIPLIPKIPSIVTIHDLTQLVYPNEYPPGIKGSIKYQIQKQALKKYSGIITISETSKKDIVRFLNIPQEKIAVVYAGVKDIYKKVHDLTKLERARAKYNLPRRYVLYVGGVNYNKNLLTLAKACKQIKTPLVIVGKEAVNEDVDLNHPENRLYAEFLRDYKDEPNVMRLGFVPDEDLLYIYNLASVYCQPSYYEGFGMPVLEAFACETPVVISKTQALVEVAGNEIPACDPKSQEDFAQKIKEILESSSIALRIVREGKKRIQLFGWEKAARLTYDFYKKILSR